MINGRWIAVIALRHSGRYSVCSVTNLVTIGFGVERLQSVGRTDKLLSFHLLQIWIRPESDLSSPNRNKEQAAFFAFKALICYLQLQQFVTEAVTRTIHRWEFENLSKGACDRNLSSKSLLVFNAVLIPCEGFLQQNGVRFFSLACLGRTRASTSGSKLALLIEFKLVHNANILIDVRSERSAVNSPF